MLNAIKKEIETCIQLPVTLEIVNNVAIFTVSDGNVIEVQNIGGTVFASIVDRDEANIALCVGLETKIPRSVVHNAIKFLVENHWNVLSLIEIQDRFTSVVLSHCDLGEFMAEVEQICEAENYLTPNIRTLNHLMQMKLAEVSEESLYLIGDDYDFEVDCDYPDFLLGNYNG